MDQKTGDCTQGQCVPFIDNFAVKVELPWSMKNEPQDQLSAVSSPVQLVSDSTSGSLLSQNASHACQRCSAVFMLSRSLEEHMEIFHGETLHSELPVASRLRDSASSDNVDQKLERSWSMKEEGQDQPSAVCSPGQPSAVSSPIQPSAVCSPAHSHVCQRCSATFVLLSSLELHTVTFHGETLCDLFPTPSACNECNSDSAEHPHSSTTAGPVEDSGKKTAVKGRKRKKGKGADTGRPDHGRKARSHMCDVCSKGFLTRGHLKAHELIHMGQRSFVCNVCSKAFTQSSSLGTHMRIHTGERPFACVVCDKTFSLASNLRRHVRIHTGQKNVCDMCGKAFSGAGNLRAHQKIHTRHKPFVCDVCSKTFSWSNNFKRHKMTHANDKSPKPLKSQNLVKSPEPLKKDLVCDDCGRTFTRAYDLKRHERTHTGLKPFVCHACSKAFVRAKSLRAHRLSRACQRACDACAKSFTTASALKRHKKVHAGEKLPPVCDVCQKTFTTGGGLKRHKRIHTVAKLTPVMCMGVLCLKIVN